METTIGLVGNGYAIVCADQNAARSIVCFKKDEDKIMKLDDFKLLGQSGVGADNVAFTEYVQKNVALYKINNGLSLSTKATNNFIRGDLATALRKGPYQTNLLLGGFDKGVGASERTHLSALRVGDERRACDVSRDVVGVRLQLRLRPRQEQRRERHRPRRRGHRAPRHLSRRHR